VLYLAENRREFQGFRGIYRDRNCKRFAYSAIKSTTDFANGTGLSSKIPLELYSIRSYNKYRVGNLGRVRVVVLASDL
jgi:hypothetical protein